MVVILVAAVFFSGTAFYNAQVRSSEFMKWGSPDENANYVFAKKYGQTGEIKIFEKYNLYAEDIIHPRSTRSDHGNIKPVSFLGIILIYGGLVRSWGYQMLPFLTPVFASLGIIFFYLLVKELFGRRNALISAFLLASFPVYIYYTTRSMFHNVLFVSLFITGLYFLVKMTSWEDPSLKQRFLSFFDPGWRNKVKGWLAAAAGGGAMGLALSVRTSEALWLLPLLFVLWIFNIKKTGITKLVIAGSVCLLALLPTAYWNQILYGSPINGGYPEMNRSIHTLADSGGRLMSNTVQGELSMFSSVFHKITDTVFYFGFDPAGSWQAFKDYFLKMFPGLAASAFLGLMLFLQFWHRRGKKFWVFFLGYLIVSVILVFYYGSWKFYDNPDQTSVTIGNSYTRYWLPVYLGAIPLAGFFLIKFSRGLFPVREKSIRVYKQKDPRNLQDCFREAKKDNLFSLRTSIVVNSIRVLIVAGFIFFSLNFVLYGSEEGLIYTAQRSRANKEIFQEVLANTERDAVVVTQYHDKLLFPERKVVYGLFNDPNMIERYSRIAERLPLYYFNFSFSDEDLEYLNSRRLKEYDLNIKKTKRINSDFSLYRLNLRR